MSDTNRPDETRDDSQMDDLRRKLRSVHGSRHGASLRPGRTTHQPKRVRPSHMPPSSRHMVDSIRTPRVPTSAAQKPDTLPQPGIELSPIRLEDSVPGQNTTAPLGGQAYVLSTALAEMEEHYHGLSETFADALQHSLRPLVSRFCNDMHLAPSDLVFMDLETTGLNATPLFLIGTMVWEDGEFVIRQYFARDYSQEAAAISLFAEDMASRALLITFNGRTFDMPYVQMRAAATGVPASWEIAHCDLLLEARKVWRGMLPNCQLQTIEAEILGHTTARDGDISGSEIPDAYHRFVRNGDARQIVQILEHNRLDLITMAEIMLRLPTDTP